MRTLIVIPIVHAIEDYGSLSEQAKASAIAQLGLEKYERGQQSIREYWEKVRSQVLDNAGDLVGVFVYQDSYPANLTPEQLAGYLVVDGQNRPKSPNYLLIRELIDKGAVLQGTEDMALVVEQVDIHKRISSASPEVRSLVFAETMDRTDELVSLRDEFIARRIRDTLPPDGKGILFIGRDHDVVSVLESLEGTDELTIEVW